uniref:Putative secreted peptide n=1 Tax=Anopheles braziliensis TaxID=58242 RepID=A0A2M3ZSV9_9DIPT
MVRGIMGVTVLAAAAATAANGGSRRCRPFSPYETVRAGPPPYATTTDLLITFTCSHASRGPASRHRSLGRVRPDHSVLNDYDNDDNDDDGRNTKSFIVSHQMDASKRSFR